jgi:hypothetical protein
VDCCQSNQQSDFDKACGKLSGGHQGIVNKMKIWWIFANQISKVTLI